MKYIRVDIENCSDSSILSKIVYELLVGKTTVTSNGNFICDVVGMYDDYLSENVFVVVHTKTNKYRIRQLETLNLEMFIPYSEKMYEEIKKLSSEELDWVEICEQ